MDARLYDVEEEREAALVAWRLECFERLGLDELTASTLAVHRDVDREDVERMVRAGATAAQVRAIVL